MRPQVLGTTHRYENGRAGTREIPIGCVLEGKRVRNNNVQRFRESLMMSKAELARKAGLSTLTIDRVEAGRPCRLDTKRKLLLALGLRVSDKDQVFAASAPELHAESPTAERRNFSS
jgi:DNA-binding XRE family transcriptional regulator